MTNKTLKIISAIFIFYIICSLGLIYISVNSINKDRVKYDDKYSKLTDIEIESFVSNCKNLEHQPTVECLNSNVNEIFKYTITEDKERLSLQDLKIKGGDCKDWSELYVKSLESLGYKGYYAHIHSGYVNHVFIYTLELNTRNLCIIDMSDYMCKEYITDFSNTELEGGIENGK